MTEGELVGILAEFQSYNFFASAEIPNEYPNDVGVDQGSNLCFAFTNLTFSIFGRSDVGHSSNEFGVAAA